MSVQNEPSLISNKIHSAKNYSAPQLIEYGNVRLMTQAGTLGPSENSGMLASEMAASDRALKENICKIGVHPLGIGLYLFDYTASYRTQHGFGRQFGVMADEVESVLPEAVSVHSDGFKRVNYGMLGIKRTTH